MIDFPEPIRLSSTEGVDIDVVVFDQGARDSIVVFMPAALSDAREDRLRPDFRRWKWAPEWEDSTVVAVADPSMLTAPALNGAWYIDSERDIIRAIADVITTLADERSIPRHRIVFYGSSLGGYGALMAASAAHARAVAEVPQIAFANWMPGAIRAVEKELLGGAPLADHGKAHPEQVHVCSRFVHEGYIPDYLIVTNEQDRSFNDALKVIGSTRKSRHHRKGSKAEVVITAATAGHAVLPRAEAVRYVNSMLQH